MSQEGGEAPATRQPSARATLRPPEQGCDTAAAADRPWIQMIVRTMNLGYHFQS